MSSKYFYSFFLFIFLAKASFGQLSFAPFQIINTGSWPKVVTIADLNNDGLDDVVLGLGVYNDTIKDYHILIFYQTTLGNLSSPVAYPYPHVFPGIASVSCGDLNHDNLNDIAIALGDSIGIYFQNSLHSFNPLKSYYSGPSVTCIKVGDVNGDGWDDIVASHSQNLKIFLQTSLGFTTYARTSIAGGGDDEVEIADVNNDGLNDAVFMYSGIHPKFQVYFQNSTTHFLNFPNTNVQPLNNLDNYTGLGVGDLNNDGRNDIAIGINSTNYKINLFYQDSILAGQFNQPDTLVSYSYSAGLEIADLDCNGTNEIIQGLGGNQKVAIYELDSLYHFLPYTLFTVPVNDFYIQPFAVGDINNDGRKDIVTAILPIGLGILVNTSVPKPSSFTSHDTLVNIDTVYHSNSEISTNYFTRTILSSDTTCFVTRNDSFLVNQTFSIDSIHVDSIFVRSVMLCKIYKDTTIHNYSFFHNALVSVDTLLLYTQTDTLFTPLLVKDTVVRQMKIFTDTLKREYFFVKEKTIENSSGCIVLQKNTYLVKREIILDSLEIDTTFIRSARTCSIIKTDSILKNTVLLDSIAISSDTSLFATSVDSVLNSSSAEFKLCNLFRVYPVPSSKLITMEMADPCFNYYETRELKIELFASNARLIFANTITSKQFPFAVDLSNYANSIYCLKVSTDGDFCIKKVIKEK